MYLCVLCEEQNFTSAQFFYKHLREHKSKHGCPKCDEIIPTKSLRRRHMKQHAQIKCNICNIDYEKLKHEEHLKYHEYLYSVDQLNGIVDIINEMQDLLPSPTKRQKMNDIEEYRGTQPNCPVKKCEKKFKNQNDLINHFMYHRANHLCKFCNEIFANDEIYEAHSTKKICRLYSCNNCAKHFSFDGFIRHIMSECENKNLFDNLDNIEPIEQSNMRKIYRIHDEIHYSCTCFVCEEEFENLEILDDHLESHEKKLNVCPNCFCVFDEDQELQDHVRIGCEQPDELPENIRTKLTDDIKQFLESRTKSRNHLVANKKVYEMFGDDSVLFQCNICNSKFVKYLYLKEHCAKLRHELIVCYKCLYLFNTWDEYRNHYCVKLDYSSFGELEFREQFQKCVKRKFETQTEIIPKNNRPLNEQDYFKKLLCNGDDVVRRMTVLIKQLEKTKFTNVNVTKMFKDTPCSSSSSTSVVNSNEHYDLNKILSRILERRHKRLFCKPRADDEDSEEELEKIGNNLHDLDICKKHLLVENNEYDLDKILPRILQRRHKRHIDEDIDNIDKFLADLGSPQNQNELAEEPPNKRNKNDVDDDDDTSDYLVKIEAFCENSA